MQSGQMTNSVQAEPAQDPGEPFDVITADGKPTGRVKSRAEVHRDGDWHRAIHVWVAGVDDRGAPFLTFQRRSPHKDTWPARYDATVGGHYRAGETLAETLREVEEEIGIIPDLRELRPLGVRVCANEAQPGIVDREIQDVFLLRDDRPLETLPAKPRRTGRTGPFPAGDPGAIPRGREFRNRRRVHCASGNASGAHHRAHRRLHSHRRSLLPAHRHRGPARAARGALRRGLNRPRCSRRYVGVSSRADGGVAC